jgi:hypothetical protein
VGIYTEKDFKEFSATDTGRLNMIAENFCLGLDSSSSGTD